MFELGNMHDTHMVPEDGEIGVVEKEAEVGKDRGPIFDSMSNVWDRLVGGGDEEFDCFFVLSSGRIAHKLDSVY